MQPEPTHTDKRKQQFLDGIGQHKGILYKVAASYTQTDADRSDLMQEMVIQLWKSFDTFDPTRSWSTWMYRVVLNVAISYYRKESTYNRTFSDAPVHLIELHSQEDQGEQAEQIQQLYAFINQLNRIDRALMLLYLDDLSYQDIADTLGITKTNVATKISRIKTFLKQQFASKNEE